MKMKEEDVEIKIGSVLIWIDSDSRYEWSVGSITNDGNGITTYWDSTKDNAFVHIDRDPLGNYKNIIILKQ